MPGWSSYPECRIPSCIRKGLYGGVCRRHKKIPQAEKPGESKRTDELSGLYVVEVSPFRIKAGRSRDPEARIKTHQANAFFYGRFEGGRSWFVRCPMELETVLLDALRADTTPVGREFFDTDFDRAVAIARRVVAEHTTR